MLLNFKVYSINLNARHVNGMTPFDICTVIRYSRVYFSSAIRLCFETDNQTNTNLSRAAGECISAPRVRRNAISNVANVSSTTDTGLKNQRDLKEETFVSSTQQ